MRKAVSTSRLVPPVYFLAAVILMIGLHLILPWPRWQEISLEAGGVALILGGLALTVAGARLFQKRGTAIRPFEPSAALVVEGPFRFTRNPMYLGMFLALTGLALLLGSAAPLLVVAAFVWLIRTRFVRVEERMLAERFGPAYEDYRRRVRRWL